MSIPSLRRAVSIPALLLALACGDRAVAETLVEMEPGVLTGRVDSVSPIVGEITIDGVTLPVSALAEIGWQGGRSIPLAELPPGSLLRVQLETRPGQPPVAARITILPE